MKNVKYLCALVVLLAATSSCGIFKKDCGCPHFGKSASASKPTRYV
ncbi:hypothetical protein [Mucilaginibacter sp. 44-25]|nr:hypothetical protein [Mucilaginibacter sp. 44-25]